MFRRIVKMTALAISLSILSAAPALSQSVDDAIRLNDQGVRLYDSARSGKQLEKALSKYQTAHRIFLRHGHTEGAAVTAMNMGVVNQDLGRHEEAIKHYEKALAFARRGGHGPVEARTLLKLGHLYSDRSRFVPARRYFEKAREVSRAHNSLPYYLEAIHGLGWVYSNLGQDRKALECYDEALGIYRKTRARSDESMCLMDLGTLFFNDGQFARALEYYRKALNLSREISDFRGQAKVLGNLGTLYNSWGDYRQTLKFREESVALFRRMHDEKGVGLELGNLGVLYFNLGLHREAEKYHKESLKIARKLHNMHSEYNALRNLGNMYAVQGLNEKAMDRYNKALALCGKMGISTATANGLIGNLYLDVGETEKAEPFAKRSGLDQLLGRLFLVKSDYDKAEDRYLKLLARAERTGHAESLFTAYTGLGAVYEAMDRYGKAAKYYAKAIDQTELVRLGLDPSQRERFFNQRLWGFFRTAPYEGLARVLMRMNKPLEAFKQSEYTKARVFAEALTKRSDRFSFNVPKEVDRKDAELAAGMAALLKKRQRGYETENRPLVDSAEAQIARLKEERAAHVGFLRRQYPLFASTKYPQPMALPETALRDAEWVLSYDVTDSGTIIYLTKGKKLVKALFKPVSRRTIDALVRGFRGSFEGVTKENLRRKLRSFNFDSGGELTRILLKDLLLDLPGGAPLIIVPDDSLGVLPFEMLVLDDRGRIATDKRMPYVKDAEFFGDRNPISYCQSVTAITLARTLGRRTRPGDRLLVMADPVFEMRDSRAQAGGRTYASARDGKLFSSLMVAMEDKMHGLSFSRLRETAKLAQEMDRIFGGMSDIFVGLEATKKHFLAGVAPKLARYGTIVFATHGYFSKDNPGFREPLLVLTLVPPGTDGFLRMSEVMGLKMNADVVALTACQSGLGRTISGEGTMGMGRAFQYAGASTALMSLWNVEQKASVTLVEGFFKHLKAGKSKLEALKLARAQIRQEGYDHPFFWAPFILVGEVD